MDDPWIFWGARVKKALSSEEITPSPHFPSTIQNLAKKEGRESRHFNHDLSNNACVCARGFTDVLLGGHSGRQHDPLCTQSYTVLCQ